MIFCCAAEAVQTTTMPPTPMTTVTQLTTTDKEDLSTTGSYDPLKRYAFPEFYTLMVYLASYL